MFLMVIYFNLYILPKIGIQSSDRPQAGFEPVSNGLKGCCSIADLT